MFRGGRTIGLLLILGGLGIMAISAAWLASGVADQNSGLRPSGAILGGGLLFVAIILPMLAQSVPSTSPPVPTPVIIVEGILVFVEAALRQLMDIKIFVDTDADIRVFRRIRRDMEQRGRSFQSIRDQYYTSVRPMHLEFVEPSKRCADLIIPEGGENTVALEFLFARLEKIAVSYTHLTLPTSDLV